MQLIYPQDILPALSGLAHKFSKAKQSDYLAGLWSDSLLQDLMWFTETWRNQKRPPAWRAPTFSWASILHESQNNQNQAFKFLDFYRIEGIDDNFTFKCKVLDAKCDVASVNSTGQVTSGYITLQGTLVQVTFRAHLESGSRANKQGRIVPYTSPAWGKTILESYPSNDFWADYDFRFNGKDHLAYGFTLYCLILGDKSYGTRSKPYMSLVLRKSDQHEGRRRFAGDVYERIGFLTNWEEENVLEESAREYVYENSIVTII